MDNTLIRSERQRWKSCWLVLVQRCPHGGSHIIQQITEAGQSLDQLPPKLLFVASDPCLFPWTKMFLRDQKRKGSGAQRLTNVPNCSLCSMIGRGRETSSVRVREIEEEKEAEEEEEDRARKKETSNVHQLNCRQGWPGTALCCPIGSHFSFVGWQESEVQGKTKYQRWPSTSKIVLSLSIHSLGSVLRGE